jgi:bifunctional enzyme CysN/CysC
MSINDPKPTYPNADGHKLRDITTEYLNKDLLRLTTAGSVDDGKSTLIGRLLYDSKAIFEDQYETLQRASELRGEKSVNLALLTDGLRAEREQGITIDVAYRYFATPRRKFIIADTPGHEQYTRNMVTGASTADLAIVLVDARHGVLTQSRRHGFIASLLGIQHVVVAVNKMDLVDFDQERFDEITADYIDFSSKLDIHDITFIPISALHGDNVVTRSERMDWYEGTSLLHHLETAVVSADRNLIDFRFPVQTVIRPDQNFRGFAGTVISGTITVGESVIALPSRQETTVRSILDHRGEKPEAAEGQAVVLTLADNIDLSRGEMVVRTHNVPRVTRNISAVLCWMDEQKAMVARGRYLLQHGPRIVQAEVRELLYRINVNTLHREETDSLRLNDIGRVELVTPAPLFVDAYRDNRANGGFILIDRDSNRTVAAGVFRAPSEAPDAGPGEQAITRAGERTTVSPNVRWEIGQVTLEQRQQRNGHKALVVWLTGLSGSGKSVISRALEEQLFEDGFQVTRLDGDNVRHGLCGDLGFSGADRAENIRRVAEVARLIYETGHIVVCSFISPYSAGRAFARELVPSDRFLEVYVHCDLDLCMERDPKGLYKKAAAGQISGMTGVDAPYERPQRPELMVDTGRESEQESISRVLALIRDKAQL